MRGAAWLAAVALLSGCASWPAGSYVGAIQPNDAPVLAAAIGDYLSAALPAERTLALPPAPPADLIAPLLDAKFANREAPDGEAVAYIATPLDGGIFLRISIADREGASRFFARRDDGSLAPAGPLTVIGDLQPSAPPPALPASRGKRVQQVQR